MGAYLPAHTQVHAGRGLGAVSGHPPANLECMCALPATGPVFYDKHVPTTCLPACRHGGVMSHVHLTPVACCLLPDQAGGPRQTPAITSLPSASMAYPPNCRPPPPTHGVQVVAVEQSHPWAAGQPQQLAQQPLKGAALGGVEALRHLKDGILDVAQGARTLVSCAHRKMPAGALRVGKI